MPYRRLPNTDKARLRAIETALNKADEIKGKQKIPFSTQLYNNLAIAKLKFQTALLNYNEALKKQKEYGKIYRESFKKAKIYISHFLQVMLMAVERGDLPKNTKKLFNIASNNIPNLTSDEDLIYWGKLIIDVEQKRIQQGLTQISNPSIGIVMGYFDKFLEDRKIYLIYKQKTKQYRENVKKQRPIIDELIRDLWNEIEDFYSNLPQIIKREKAKQFGVVYFFRKTEEKISLEDILNF